MMFELEMNYHAKKNKIIVITHAYAHTNTQTQRTTAQPEPLMWLVIIIKSVLVWCKNKVSSDTLSPERHYIQLLGQPSLT